MSRYRRARIAGACYFFTVVAHRRESILCNDAIRHALRNAILSVREHRPFSIDAWVLLPDHLHCIWTLPDGDSDYPTRWGIIKRNVSIACATGYKRTEFITQSRSRHRESTLRQRRFWEHRIRGETDFIRHVDYIHHNPVKHGLCLRVTDWPYSSFHRYVADGVYPEEWCGTDQDTDMPTAGE